MAKETPKKIVDESLKCFTCSSLCSGKERIYIFGNTTHNFAEIIKSALNINVNCYADDTNSKLFACKTSCYKRLLKFCYGARGTMGYVMLRCAMHHGMCNKTSQLLYSQDGVCVNFLPLARGTQLFQVLTFKFLFENIHVNVPQI